VCECCTSVCKFVCVYVCAYLCVYIYIFVCVRAYVYTNLCAPVCLALSKCMLMCALLLCTRNDVRTCLTVSHVPTLTPTPTHPHAHTHTHTHLLLTDFHLLCCIEQLTMSKILSSGLTQAQGAGRKRQVTPTVAPCSSIRSTAAQTLGLT